jgi:hypothetical protein
MADHTMASIADQLLLPQSSYIDVLLDLLVVAPSPIVRSAIADRLSEVRFVRMVATEEVRADLYGIVAISDFSDAESDDMEWAERALTCTCESCEHAVRSHRIDGSSTTADTAPEACA